MSNLIDKETQIL